VDSWWDRLARRKLVQWTVAYLGASWLVIQVLTLLGETFHWPEAAAQIATALLGVGFVGAVIAAWYHGEKGAQRVSGAELVMIATLFILAGGVLALLSRARTQSDPAQDQGSRPDTASSSSRLVAEQGSIAVLPFANMSADAEQEFFSDGIAEEILDALTKVPGLRVASRTSAFQFKGQRPDLVEVATKLRVAHVLEGSVRRAGNRVRISAQLISAADGFHVWSSIYDRELTDIFAIQEEIARAIVDTLKIQLGSSMDVGLARAGTSNVEAYTLYLEARFHYFKYTEMDLHRSIDLARQAIAIDSGFARPYAVAAGAWNGLADDWVAPNQAYPHAQAAALEAIGLDASLAEAHAALAGALLWYDWDFDGAERAARTALALDATSADAHSRLGAVLSVRKKNEEAETELRRAISLDSATSTAYQPWLARHYLQLGRYDDAIAEARALLEIDAQQLMGYRVLGDGLLGQSRAEEALATYRQGLAFDSNFVRLRSGEARSLAALNRREEALRIAVELERESQRRYVRIEEVAMIYVALGDADRAFALLDRALADRSAGLIYLDQWPAWDALRTDPRFAGLKRRAGLS
jgi:TolB-like protein